MRIENSISVRGLSKFYTITHNEVQQSTLAETLLDRLRRPFAKRETETFWALRDISFDIKRGDVVGIIGRNGAGKSTLLKILSQITEPTSGAIDLFGRVGSLLEVGTGFHPELSGRENIYLNGAILGMRRGEISRQFSAIVEFAGVEKFLDTPVKRYSSGMYVRLAFAVAAHLDPEILIVDEVLAVGDSEFQRKCLDKIKDVASSGRTVLFVSHNMSAVKTLCSSAILLNSGRLVSIGPVESVMSEYLSAGIAADDQVWRREGKTLGALTVEQVSCEVIGKQPSLVLGIDVVLASNANHLPAFIAFDIIDGAGNPVMQALPTLDRFIKGSRKVHNLEVKIDLPPLIPDRYTVGVWVGSHNTETLDCVSRCVMFEVLASPTIGRSFPHHADHGHIVPNSTVGYRENVNVETFEKGGTNGICLK